MVDLSRPMMLCFFHDKNVAWWYHGSHAHSLKKTGYDRIWLSSGRYKRYLARNNHHSQPRHLTKHGTRQGITVIVQDTTYIRQEELEPTRPEHFAAAELKRSNAKFPATFLSHSPSLWPSPPLSLYLAHSETHILSLLYFPAQLVRGFTLSDVLDKPWSQVSSLLPPGTRLPFIGHMVQHSHCSSIFIECR